MSPVERGFQTQVGLALGSSYGSEVSIPNAAGVRYTGGLPTPKLSFHENNDLAGSAAREPDLAGNETLEGSLNFDLHYDGASHLALAAGIGVAGTPTLLAGTAYSNKFTLTEEIEKFYTLVAKRIVDAANCPNGIWVYPSTFTEEIKISIDENVWKVTIQIIADQLKMASSVVTSLASLTYTDSHKVRRKDTVLRINDNAGGALGSGDILKFSTAEITIKNALAMQHASGSKNILIPVRGGFRQVSLNLKFPRSEDYNLLADFLGDTLKKADIIATGPEIASTGYYNKFGLLFPRIQLQEPDVTPNGPGLVEPSFNFKCFDSNQPTGMSSVNGEVEVQVQNTQSTSLTT